MVPAHARSETCGHACSHRIVVICILITTLLAALPRESVAQDPQVEKLLEEEAEYSDQSDLMDRLAELEKNPIDLNRVDIDGLDVLPWISPGLARDIVRLREEKGRFNSIDELNELPGLTSDIYETIKSYVIVGAERQPREFLMSTRSRLNRKLEKSAGYSSGDYYNSPNKYYHQIRAAYTKNYDAGLVLEKDQGEKKINDLTLGFLRYQDDSGKNRLILGNYRLEFGQGLAFWNPYSYGKSASPIYPAIKKERNLLHYTMVDENSALFGAAMQTAYRSMRFFGFYSKMKLDATLNGSGGVENLYSTGYHRNELELEKKDTLEEQLIGARMTYARENDIRIGATVYASEYDRPLENSDYSRKRFAFRGSRNHVSSVDFQFRLTNQRIFGEYAQSKNRGWGLVLGTVFAQKNYGILMQFRNYSKDFHSLHGAGFGERGGVPENEQGFYTGVSYRLFRNTRLFGYFDVFRFPWRTYFEKMPVNGNDFLIQIEHKVNRTMNVMLRFKRKRKEQALSGADDLGRATEYIESENRSNLRFQFEYNPLPPLKLRFRSELVEYDHIQKSRGLLMYQDVRYRVAGMLTFYARLTFFDTDDYNSRVYQFENDIPYVLTNQMLYGEGSRWYLCMIYDYKDWIRLSSKFGVNYYEDTERVGTGYDMIEGNTYRTFSLQLETDLRVFSY